MYPLNEYVQATADANGDARATTGPNKYGDSWVVRNMAVSSTSTSESQLRVYRGVESPSALVLSTYSANQDTAGGNELTVVSQDKLVFVWSNATAGAICTVRLEGDLNSRRT